jgi:hypothetical protein
MAEKKLEKLKDEFAEVSALTREAYDAIYGRASYANSRIPGEGLDGKYKWAVANQAKSDIAKKALKTLKPLWEQRQETYKKYQEQKNALSKQLKTAEKEADKAKKEEAKQKLAVSGYEKALKDLRNAEIELGTYKGDTKYIDAYQKAQAARENAIESGAKPKELPAQKIQVPTPEVKEDKAGKGKGAETQDVKNIGEFFDLIADPANKQLLIEVQKDLIKNFGWTGKADGKYSLSFQNAVASAAETRDTLPKSLRGTTFRGFLSNPGVDLGIKGGAGAGAVTSRKQTDVSITKMTEGEINQDINDISVKILGREITAEDKNQDWYKGLVSSINKMVEKGTTTVTEQRGLGSAATRNKYVTTPAFAQEDIEALIERRLKKADPESLARTERIDFITWMNNALGDR